MWRTILSDKTDKHSLPKNATKKVKLGESDSTPHPSVDPADSIVDFVSEKNIVMLGPRLEQIDQELQQFPLPNFCIRKDAPTYCDAAKGCAVRWACVQGLLEKALFSIGVRILWTLHLTCQEGI